ncbi:hypothetical protein PIB30_060825 [Stylosanthes scabra]|uniref:Uncharacterized protein n=1 Tax=Stylosanthes scabra TaxID=79078 RepID=A0ABU6RL12_9FABA|nr:hypothetical protein [Stylosanthes scabra]
MEGDESFLALIHHDGKIRYKTRKGVKFTNKSPTNVFITSRTTLLDLQRSIIRKLGLDGRKRVSMIYYRIPISVVAQGVKSGCFAVEGDDDLQILFYCRRQFPKVRTTENQSQPDVRPVTLPSFDVNLQAEATTGEDELGDSCSFVELGVAIAATPQLLPPQAFQAVPDPDHQVSKALRPDDSNDELQFINGDSDDDVGHVPPQAPQGGTSSRAHNNTHLICRVLTWILYLVLVRETVGRAAVHRFSKG